MTYKLFLDDLRPPPDHTWVVARSVAAAIHYVNTFGLPIEMSLDHDLGGEADAPALLHYLIGEWLDHDKFTGLTRVKMNVHSANPVGFRNLTGLWKSFVDNCGPAH